MNVLRIDSVLLTCSILAAQPNVIRPDYQEQFSLADGISAVEVVAKILNPSSSDVSSLISTI